MVTAALIAALSALLVATVNGAFSVATQKSNGTTTVMVVGLTIAPSTGDTPIAEGPIMSKKKRLRREIEHARLQELRAQRLRRAAAEDPDFAEAAAALRVDFQRRFGRPPGPGDPVFFDPTASEPKPLPAAGFDAMVTDVLRAMFDAGVDPELAYAYAQSGYLVSERNHDLIPPEGQAAWNAALEEWRHMSETDRAVAIQAMKAGNLGQ